MDQQASDGYTLGFTGLSGSGKWTSSRLIYGRLCEAGLRVELLDGDAVRQQLSYDLGVQQSGSRRDIRFTGVSDPYEPPLHPDITLDTSKDQPRPSAQQVWDYLHRPHAPALALCSLFEARRWLSGCLSPFPKRSATTPSASYGLNKDGQRFRTAVSG